MNRFALISALAILAACSQQAPVVEPQPAPIVVTEPVTAADAHHDAYIVSIQQALVHKGYYHGQVDGVCGPATKAAVKRYQHDLGVRAHNHCAVGHKEWSSLGLSSGEPAPPPAAAEPAPAPPAAPHERQLKLE